MLSIVVVGLKQRIGRIMMAEMNPSLENNFPQKTYKFKTHELLRICQQLAGRYR